MVFGVSSQFPCEAPEGRDKVEGNLCSDPENARVSGIPFVLRYRRIGLPTVRAEVSKPCVESVTGFLDES